MSDSAIRIADVDVPSISSIVDLFSSYYRKEDTIMHEEYLKWIYIDNVFGFAKGVFAETEGKLVGFMALIPVRVAHAGSKFTAHYVVNVLVHPEHQGKNLFAKMISSAVAYSKQIGAALIGHPNDQAIKFWQRKRMSFQDELRPTMMLPGLAGGAKKIYRLGNVNEIRGYIGNDGAFFGADKGVSVDVSIDYLNWRYLSHPENRYILIGAEMRNGASILQVVRRLSFARYLFIDRFANRPDSGIQLGGLPVVTAVFRPSSEEFSVMKGIVALPLRKRIPYFVTMFDLVPGQENLSMIGLSASDF